MENSTCLHRCDLLTYTLIDEPVTAYDKDLQIADLYLYFGSPSLEVWTEYRLVSFLDFLVGLGGTVGLILGMSVLSILLLLIKALDKGLKKVTRGRKISI